jgi:hypothetical protein
MSLFVLGGAYLVGQALTPLLGSMSYVATMIIFVIIGYYLNGLLRRRKRTSGPAYSPPQQAYPSPQQPIRDLPPQPPSQVRMRYTPEQVRGVLRDIVTRYNAGEINLTSFERLLTDHVYADAYGDWWTIDVKTGKWVQQKDGAWVEAEPPPWLERSLESDRIKSA